MKIPYWLRRYFKDSDIEKVRVLIEDVEQLTQAELVPVIVRSSIDLWLFRAFLISLSLALTLIVVPILESYFDWGFSIPLEVLYGVILGLFTLSAFLSANCSFVVKLIFKKSHLEHVVFRRACAEFFDNQLHKAHSRTAVLFMYSVLERKAMVIADPNLHTLPPELWKTAVLKMTTAAKNKAFYQGFKEAIEYTASSLASQFPPQLENKNEISDQVLIKE